MRFTPHLVVVLVIVQGDTVPPKKEIETYNNVSIE